MAKHTRLMAREALARGLIAEMDAADRAFRLLLWGFSRGMIDASAGGPRQQGRNAYWNTLLELTYRHREGAHAALVVLMREGSRPTITRARSS